MNSNSKIHVFFQGKSKFFDSRPSLTLIEDEIRQLPFSRQAHRLLIFSSSGTSPPELLPWMVSVSCAHIHTRQEETQATSCGHVFFAFQNIRRCARMETLRRKLRVKGGINEEISMTIS